MQPSLRLGLKDKPSEGVFAAVPSDLPSEFGNTFVFGGSSKCGDIGGSGVFGAISKHIYPDQCMAFRCHFMAMPHLENCSLQCNRDPAMDTAGNLYSI